MRDNESENSGWSEDEDSTTHCPAKKNKTATILSDDEAALAQDLNYEVDIEDYTGSQANSDVDSGCGKKSKDASNSEDEGEDADNSGDDEDGEGEATSTLFKTGVCLCFIFFCIFTVTFIRWHMTCRSTRKLIGLPQKVVASTVSDLASWARLKKATFPLKSAGLRWLLRHMFDNRLLWLARSLQSLQRKETNIPWCWLKKVLN